MEHHQTSDANVHNIQNYFMEYLQRKKIDSMRL